MGVLLQIAIPLFVTLAALIAIAIWKKYFAREVLAVCGVLLIGGITFLSMHFSGGALRLKNGAELSQTDEISLILAEEYIADGRCEDALQILNDLSEVNGNSAQIQTAMARASFLNGNYTAAIQMYQLLGDSVKEELNYAVALGGASQSNDNAIISYMTMQGANIADYGLQKKELLTGDPETAQTFIREKIVERLAADKQSQNSDLIDAIEAAVNITMRFEAFLEGEEILLNEDGEEIPALSLDTYMVRHETLRKNRYLRIARLKEFVLNGTYGKIAKAADEYTTAEELLILAELYTGGHIDEEDFAENCINLDLAYCKSMVEKCLSILEGRKDSLTQAQYDRYKNKLDDLSIQIKTPALFSVRYNLQWQANDGKEELRSKCYLALAKIEKHNKNLVQSEAYILDALGTAADSDDENYRLPMTQISGVIAGTADSEEIKQIAASVDSALDHSLPITLIIHDPVEEEDMDDYGESYYGEQDYDEDRYFGGGLPIDEETERDEEESSVGEEQDASEEQVSFNDYMTNTVTQCTATINIGAINKDEFPTVKARVQIHSSEWTSLEEIREHLKVYDCGSEIKNFTLEKVEYSQSNIILLCDVSGSMSGSEDSLKEAIAAFAEDMGAGERVSVIGFDDSIVFEQPFSADPEKVKDAIDKISAGGGTRLFSSLLHCGSAHNQDINANNIIIAMTDGQDGDRVGEGEMYNQLTAMAADKNITVYTLGLGSGVDTAYLEQIADFGNGSFLYVESREALEAFYAFIHGQLNNQYILTYEARNETLNERKLELSIEGELGGAQKTYYLQDKVYTDEGGDSYNPYTVEDATLSVNGLETKFFYRSSKEQTVNLRGSSFNSGDEVTVRITGNVKYELPVTFVNETTYRVTIPPEVSIGTYDMTVSIRGESLNFAKELTIAPQSTEKNFRFGGYNFTALNSYKNENGDTVLSGNVMLGGWLRFRGDITLSDPNGADKVLLTDNSGSYVCYASTTAKGLAKAMAEKGLSLCLDPLGSLYLYNTPYTAEEYEDFTVDTANLDAGVNLAFWFMEYPDVALYPDMLRIKGVNVQSFEFPLQKQIMRGFELNDVSGNLDTEMLINATGIAAKGNVKFELGDSYDFSMISFPMFLSEMEIDIDTLKNDYSLKGAVKFKALKSMESIEMGFAVKDGRFDGLSLKQNKGFSVTLLTSPVPVSMKDFGFELAGFSKYESDDTLLSKILDTDISILFDVDVADAKKLLPGLAKFIDDENEIAAATLEDCKLTANLREFRFSFDADIKVFTILDFGECHVSLGHFDYTNALIGYYNKDQYGLQVAVTVGPSIKTTNLTMSAQGKVEMTVGYPYTGIWLNGKADFEIGWWILSADVDVSGDVLLGLYENSSGNLQFSTIVKGTNKKGKNSGFHLYVTRTKGFNIDKY